ncbi:SNF2 family N-terminal domain-containing protein [Emericellopsis atlantica]|uniref:SNF2 family N-terminal domain-containing protein n=1 Tax=Emericellopsis atlantica TaxID=2614577 RepID=A0A9P8CQE8_9HYPO|nr:SNF2 family N-terminal domain-containing protein [Emericellopsis atlantica]KAG9255237.1 SNF2 family N-terminal domain-containing protein [Emericellopsis atlantica]
MSIVKTADGARLTIQGRLYWNETQSPRQGLRNTDSRGASEALIDRFFPKTTPDSAASSPMDFYDAAHVPSADETDDTLSSVPGLEATLFPYQRRSLKWLLRREGVRCTAAGTVVRDEQTASPITDSFRLIRDTQGQPAYVSDVMQTIVRDTVHYRQIETAMRGGILAEEMGLGKTLEIIGLVLMHPRPDPEPGDGPPSGGTLLVVPQSLRDQWVSEIARHAPILQVEIYNGCAKSQPDNDDALVKRLSSSDVVITTYHVLQSEVHFAREPPQRSRRTERKYERPKSPLVRINWWRLCIDEAQMIENGLSNAAETARAIPRVNSWAITGTPLKNDVSDLFHLLTFLRYEPLTTPTVWKFLVKEYKPVLQSLVGTIAIRHTKSLVRHEIALPPQHRFAISVPFTAVEEQHYQSLFKQMTEACDVDEQGKPIVEDWKPSVYEEAMRTWLNRLRQTALHPEIGAYSRRVLGHSNRPMRTLDEVLRAMIEQSDNGIKAHHRSILGSRLTRGQLYENSPRVREALSIWTAVREEAAAMVAEARAGLSEASAHSSRADKSASSLDMDSTDDESVDNKGAVRAEWRRKLRQALETQHKAVFFCANAYFQIRENTEMTVPESADFEKLKEAEDQAYEEAKLIRKELLKSSHHKASGTMQKLSEMATRQKFTEIAELPTELHGGIESSRVAGDLEALHGAMNEQANVIDQWREHAVQLLLKPLMDQDEDPGLETTGEEMGDAAKMQEELIVYVQALGAAIADRQDAMSGQPPNELVSYETKQAIRLAREGGGPMPDKLLELMQIRQQVNPRVADFSMRGALADLRSLATRLSKESSQTDRVRNEHAIAAAMLKATQTALTQQNKAATALESELESFRDTMNARLEYYRQMQSVSDSVLPYEGPKTEDAAERMLKYEEDLTQKLASAKSKHRYLLNLKDTGTKSDEGRLCVICQTHFDIGVLTVCGHQFCKPCMKTWYRAHRNCPVCKTHLLPSSLHDIVFKSQELKLHGTENEHAKAGQASPEGTSGILEKGTIYSQFDAAKLSEIQDIDLEGPSYTTKVDTIVRHLLWLRQSDPGAKSIIFSQYKDFLKILSTAFDAHRIGFSSIDAKGGIERFKQDPAVEAFLMHARAHSSGLNLVNANNVFLCEPLVNTALELQAIARVDRIGQQHETTVWLYVTQGTVEESIYSLSVERRLEHAARAVVNGKGKEKAGSLDETLEAANTLEMEQAALTKLMSKDRTAGEMVDKNDLWQCLFGHVAKNGAPTGEEEAMNN